MIEWSDQHRMIQETVRKFVEAEIVPQLEELEHGDLPPYDVLRKLFKTFGMDELARTRFDRQIARQESAGSSGAAPLGAIWAPSEGLARGELVGVEGAREDGGGGWEVHMGRRRRETGRGGGGSWL